MYSFGAAEGDWVIATMSHDDDVSPFLEVRSDSSQRFGYFNSFSTELVQLWPGGEGFLGGSGPVDPPRDDTGAR